MNTMGNLMKNMLRLMPMIVCALMLHIGSGFAVPPPQEPGNSHGTVWEEWQPLAEGFIARRRVPERLDLPEAQRRSPATQAHLLNLPGAPGRNRSTPAGQKPPTNARSREALMIWLYTGAPGLHGVHLNDISAETGIAVDQLRDAVRKGRLSFSNEGEAVSWYFDAAYDRLLFAGEKYETFYAEGNAYYLQQTPKSDPQHMIERGNARDAAPAGTQTPFPETLHFEQEKALMFFTWLDPTNPDFRYWYWDYLYGAARPQIPITLSVPDPAAYGTARITVRLYGLTDLYPGNDHRVFAKLNGQAVGTVRTWDGLNPAELLIDVDQAILNPGGHNILTLCSLYDATRPYPGELLESIAVAYLRLPVAKNGQLWMRDVVQGAQEVAGFTGSDILVIESPVRDAVLRKDVSVYPDGNGGWAVAFNANAGGDYLIVERSAFLAPVIDPRKQANLTDHGNRADYLIIAPREFSGTAQALAAHRQDQYGAIQIVWLDDIYKSFAAGRADPFAIGRFMDHVMAGWALAPSTVTLVGKGSMDRKDRMGYGDNFLPVLMTANPWALAASDARLLGSEDGATLFAFGRLPITNDAEGLAYVAKLSAHASASGDAAAYRAVVAADNPDSGGDFHADADRLIAQLEDLGFAAPVTPLYHPTQAVRTNLTRSETWESGFISYSGHGGTRQLGNNGENFMNAADAGALRNTVYPVFTAMTCSAGSDAFPGTRSLAGTLVLNPAGGAIAALAPTGASGNADAHVLGGAFIDNLYGGYRSVGDALASAIRQTSGEIDDFMAPIYSVIGDPGVYAR